VEAQYSPLYRELGDGTTIWSPLASGVLTGRYNDGIRAGTRRALPGYAWQRSMVLTPERIERVKRLAGIAADLRCTLPQMALAWCLKNPNVSMVITGASRPEQVRENLKAQEVAPLMTDEVMARIEGGGAREQAGIGLIRTQRPGAVLPGNRCSLLQRRFCMACGGACSALRANALGIDVLPGMAKPCVERRQIAT
jgi:diketogulonate reductase-like aldo/keto reductase